METIKVRGHVYSLRQRMAYGAPRIDAVDSAGFTVATSTSVAAVALRIIKLQRQYETA